MHYIADDDARDDLQVAYHTMKAERPNDGEFLFKWHENPSRHVQGGDTKMKISRKGKDGMLGPLYLHFERSRVAPPLIPSSGSGVSRKRRRSHTHLPGYLSPPSSVNLPFDLWALSISAIHFIPAQ
ncbi:hypothetical protein D9611_001082 [Ephemerocybe angulata]|uniref:Uncharacterized protein n=1 Tax=Ephemerocybe angulata TaxID=980116 RepID=A0A8H5CJ34_9AGAR|nr:hypothetical protein D9611_001082 [Tulosesus angulatus]